MEGGNGDSGSYWLDACEDIPCDLIDGFVDFDTPIVNDSVDNNANQDNLVHDFFGGIDRILDSIKNGSGLPPYADCTNHSNGAATILGNAIQVCGVEEGSFDNGGSADCKTEVEGFVLQLSSEKGFFERRRKLENCNNVVNALDGKGEERLSDNSAKENGSKCEIERSREGDFSSEERFSKRARHSGQGYERLYSCRGHYDPNDRERGSGRKRTRDWDEMDRRDRDHSRRRDRYGCGKRRDCRDRDWRDKEPRGYWERDHSGSNGMVFRLGSWEAEHKKEGKETNDKNHEYNGKPENKSEEAKEKVPEEQARQYQLDVLEQAKKKNTIAFLETGAGKTLIAVLLIRSVCNDLQKQNKKMLAVFLVPKVPLVYQVPCCLPVFL